jgi:hypothetical protein
MADREGQMIGDETVIDLARLLEVAVDTHRVVLRTTSSMTVAVLLAVTALVATITVAVLRRVSSTITETDMVVVHLAAALAVPPMSTAHHALVTLKTRMMRVVPRLVVGTKSLTPMAMLDHMKAVLRPRVVLVREARQRVPPMRKDTLPAAAIGNLNPIPCTFWCATVYSSS